MITLISDTTTRLVYGGGGLCLQDIRFTPHRCPQQKAVSSHRHVQRLSMQLMKQASQACNEAVVSACTEGALPCWLNKERHY